MQSDNRAPQGEHLEAQVDLALQEAHLPTLALAMVHLTGERRFIERVKPVYRRFDDDQGNFPESFVAELKAAARTAILAHCAGAPLAAAPSMETVRKMLDFSASAAVPERYLPYILDELKLDGVDPRQPRWDDVPKPGAAAMKVVVIGAGMSGLLAGIRLGQAGIAYEIIEKHEDVGGVWLENTYPGCRVDSANHLYNYSFVHGHEWPNWFSRQGVLLDYFRQIADRFQLRPHIRFRTEVVSARFNEATSTWNVRVRDKSGQERVIQATAVISAVGQLNQPKYPDIPGIETFAGETMHSARWRPEVELAGKRVAVIGTGASAYQIIPEIAASVQSLTVFQRSPVWATPQPDYHYAVGEGFKWLLKNVPFYEKWFRFRQFWRSTEGVYSIVKKDPEWHGEGNSISLANKEFAESLAQRMREQLVGAEHLIAHVIPTFPYGGKRTLRDNGTYLAALRRDNVELVPHAIAGVDQHGVIAADGQRRDVDVIVFATGFHASDFLRTFEVTGRGGKSLKEKWAGDPKAYLGLMVPDFPNFFVLYGPNTNLVANGSKFLFSECGVRYIMECLKTVAQAGKQTIEVKQSSYDRYNDEVDALNAQMAWGAPEVQNWYKNPSTGRVSQNWPFRSVEYWFRTRTPIPEDVSVR